jgi:hypothetical protein
MSDVFASRKFKIGETITVQSDQGTFTGKVHWLPSNGAVHIENDLFNVRFDLENMISETNGVLEFKKQKLMVSFRINVDHIRHGIKTLAQAKFLHSWQKKESAFLIAPQYPKDQVTALLAYFEEQN